jgi:hypothetical protein
VGIIPTGRNHPPKKGKIFPLFGHAATTRQLGDLMLKLAQGRPPESKKDAKFASFSGKNATARYAASLHGVSYRTVQNAAEFAEVVITVPSVPPVPLLAPPTNRLPKRVQNLHLFQGLMQPRGNWATCGKRKRGKFDRVLQREPKCAPLR